MNKKFSLIWIIFLCMVVSPVLLFSEKKGELSLSLTPGGVIPSGSSAQSFTFGGGGDLSADLSFQSFPKGFLKVQTSYIYLPLVSKDGVSVISVLAGGGIRFSPVEKLKFSAYGTGGYFYSQVSGGSSIHGGNISLKGGVAVSYALSPALSLTGDISYLYNFYLNQGLGLSLGASYSFPLNISEEVRSPLPVKPQPLDETKVKRTGAEYH